MNETSNVVQSKEYTEFAFRRLQESVHPYVDWFPASLGGQSNLTWLVLLAFVLAVALFYVVWMYIKDSQGIGIIWASVLGLLRLSVYAILAIVFLLPSKQKFNETVSQGEVLVVMDVSDSMHTSDQLPSGKPNERLRTRMEDVLAFMTSEKVNFIGNLDKKNPVSAYRFGTKLDTEYLYFTEGNAWTREEKEKPKKLEVGLEQPEKKSGQDDSFWFWIWGRGFLLALVVLVALIYLLVRFIREVQTNSGRATLIAGVGVVLVVVFATVVGLFAVYYPAMAKSRQDALAVKDQEQPKQQTTTRSEPLSEEYWQAWLTPRAPFRAVGLNEKQQERLETLDGPNKKAIKDGMPRGTSIGDSLLSLINKKLNSRLQGIVVFTDGRNTEGQAGAFRELEARAKSARIPIFVVGIGQDRQRVKIEINELRLPPTIQPDDKFRSVVDITGVGLADQKVDVTLEIVHVRTFKEKSKNKEGKIVETEKEELLPIEVIEAEDENNPKKTRDKFVLGTKLELKPPSLEVKFDRSNPPRLEVEWQLDAQALATAVGRELPKGKKWEIGETKDDSEFKVRVLVPTDPREGLGEKKFHESDRAPMKVIKKPVRVLLMAAAANRDYQFVRTLLVRESEKKRLELSVHLQLPPGEIKRRLGVVQDVPSERFLTRFPSDIGKSKGDLYDLSSYDVIVAFDPDWEQMTVDQIALIKKFCEKGGGFVLIAGHINTFKLIRSYEGADSDRAKPILDILPIVPSDGRELVERNTSEPFDLKFEGATAEMEFLKLDEELDETKFLEDWKAYFYGVGRDRTEKPQRGFYNFYPAEKVKPGSLVVARYTDPDPQIRLKDGGLQPYIVTNPDELSRVVWIGSAETWRLREYREEFHERFWTKLVRYAASKSKGGVLQSIRPEAAKIGVVNKPFTVEARIDGADGAPLPHNIKEKPEIVLQVPVGVDGKEINQGLPVQMSPRPGARDGWFNASFIPRSPGQYELTIRVPKQPGQESDQTATHQFIVKEANPELDNTRPDFPRLYRLASEADDVLKRMNDADRGEVKRRLSRPKVQEADQAKDKDAAKDELETRDDKLRLYFDLGNAELIPTCMNPDRQTQVSMGDVTDMYNEDVYDLTFRLGLRNQSGELAWPWSSDKRQWEPPTRQERPLSNKLFSWVLIVVVGLFSTEWLIRKLLRLA